MARVITLVVALALMYIPGAENRARREINTSKEPGKQPGAKKGDDLSEQMKLKPWLKAKPPKESVDGKCTSIVKYYDTVTPSECQSMMITTRKSFIPCKPFCEQWSANLKRVFELDDDCKFDDRYQVSWCESKIKSKDCRNCKDHKGRIYSMCCGTCTRLCKKT